MQLSRFNDAVTEPLFEPLTMQTHRRTFPVIVQYWAILVFQYIITVDRY